MASLGNMDSLCDCMTSSLGNLYLAIFPYGIRKRLALLRRSYLPGILKKLHGYIHIGKGLF